MLSIALIAVLSITLFSIGYYFGNQMGSTRHIRQQLAEVRTSE